MTPAERKQALRANRDMLVLLDRAIAEARQQNAALALATRDIDSFFPYRVAAVGADGAAGLLTVSNGVVSGLIQVESDAAFVVTGVVALFPSFPNPLFDRINNDLRFVETSNGRDLNRTMFDTLSEAPSAVYSGALQLSPQFYQLVEPMTLPRNASVRVTARNHFDASNTNRLFVAFDGYKVFGD